MAKHFLKYKFWYLGLSSFAAFVSSSAAIYYFTQPKDEKTELSENAKANPLEVEQNQNDIRFEGFERNLDSQFSVNKESEASLEANHEAQTQTFLEGDGERISGAPSSGIIKVKENRVLKKHEEIYVEIEVPHMVEARLKTEIQLGVLQLSGPVRLVVRRELEGAESQHSINAYFFRRFQLPQNVDIQKIEVFSVGTLVKIHLPLIGPS